MNIKTIMLGASGVGKTRFLNYLRKTSMTSYCPTIGVDYVVYRSDFSVTLQIWDTSGSDRFKSVVNNFLKGCDLIIFVYNDHQTFHHMTRIFAVPSSRSWKILDGAWAASTTHLLFVLFVLMDLLSPFLAFRSFPLFPFRLRPIVCYLHSKSFENHP